MANRVQSAVIAILLSLISSAAQCSEDTKEHKVIILNNEGVIALNHKDWALSIEKFEAALKIEPDYKLARQNLAIAHKDRAKDLASTQKKFAEAIKEYHTSIFLNPNPYFSGDLNDAIREMGKDPSDFSVRMNLGDEARDSGDLRGALVEYRAALAIKKDPTASEKEKTAFEQLSANDKEIDTHPIHE